VLTTPVYGPGTSGIFSSVAVSGFLREGPRIANRLRILLRSISAATSRAAVSASRLHGNAGFSEKGSSWRQRRSSSAWRPCWAWVWLGTLGHTQCIPQDGARSEQRLTKYWVRGVDQVWVRLVPSPWPINRRCEGAQVALGVRWRSGDEHC
jgi:hypothetical protein